MTDLFTAALIDLPEEAGTYLPTVAPACCVCGTCDVFRIQPGQLAGATPLWYRPNDLANGEDVPTVAFCLAHDPVFSTVTPRVPDGEAEVRSWVVA